MQEETRSEKEYLWVGGLLVGVFIGCCYVIGQS